MDWHVPSAEAGTDVRGTSYEEVPYPSRAFAETHPDHLATLARLFGLTPPPVERCRVLELGCAAGSNLIPMALSLPGSHFVGVDLSSRQIAEGQATAAALGLTNVVLEVLNLADVGSGLGRFDFIIAHGVYSWVEEALPRRSSPSARTICPRTGSPWSALTPIQDGVPGAWSGR